MYRQIKVWNTLAESVAVFLGYLPKWVKITWLPMLLAILAALLTNLFYVDKLNLRNVPVMMENLVQAVFFSIVFVSVFRATVGPGEKIPSAISPDKTGVFLVAASLIVLDALVAGLSWINNEFLVFLFVDVPYENRIGLVFWSASLIVMMAVSAIAIPIFSGVSIFLATGKVSLNTAFKLIAKNFWRLFFVVLLLTAAMTKLNELYYTVCALLGFEYTLELPVPYRDALGRELLYYLWSIPVLLVNMVIPPITVGLIYNVLAPTLPPGNPSHRG